METMPPKAEVTIYSPLFSPFRHPLTEETISIGRASDCSIPIKDRYLSRRHAEIVQVDGHWVLKDLGSANGTYLNGNRVERDSQLRAGDRIRLGDTEIVFETAELNTDKVLAIADTRVSATIAIPIHDIDESPQAADIDKLTTLNLLARELIEDRPMDELFGFIVDRVMQHLQPSRAALGLLGADGRSFVKVEVRRQDRNDSSELTISHTLLQEVVEERKALAFMDVMVDEKLSRAQSIIMQGIHSILCAPLIIGESVVGVLYVDYLFNQRQISPEDVKLVAQIGRFAAAKLETTRLREDAIQKRLMDEELKTASTIQRRLLPDPPTGIPGYTFVGANRPCRTVSGDYFDFVVRPDGKIYFVIADVSGKGVTAGLMMAGLQAAFRIYAKNDPDPAQLVSQLNVTLKENLPQSKFVTLFLGRLDTKNGLVEYANAGHTPPLLMGKNQVTELGETDLLLGVVTNAEYTLRTLQLDRGDSLILFTDGVTEAEDADGSEFGSTLLAEKLKPMHGSLAGAIARIVEESVIAHVGAADALGDDVTLVVVSRNA